MSNFCSVDEALDFAIDKEQEAHDFYTDLAGKMDKQWMAQIFMDFAKEEAGHKEKLLAVKSGGKMEPAKENVVDLKIADYLAEVDPDTADDYQKALIVAMKAEKAAFKLYTDLATSTEDTGIRDTFLVLAQEEAKHKLRIEVEYDDVILAEN